MSTCFATDSREHEEVLELVAYAGSALTAFFPLHSPNVCVLTAGLVIQV